VQINNSISNSVALPVAPAGSRTCTMTSPAFTTADVVQLASLGKGTFTFGGIDLKRNDNYPSPGFRDHVEGEFLRLTVDPAVQPFVVSYIDAPPLGTCQIFNNLNGQPDPPIGLQAGLDAGPQITVQGPAGSQSASGSGGGYSATLGGAGNFFSPGTITVSAPGGKDVHSFSASITLPALPTMTSPPPDAANPFSVTRSSGLTVIWAGGSANTYIELDGFSATDNTYSNGVSFQCSVPAGPGSFTIPPSVLLALPANNFGGLDFRPGVMPVAIPGTGLNITQLTLQYDYFTPLAFK
jgi:hypothetical protein